jgi:hypothetical protein
MRINIISNFGKNTGLNQDTFILRGILTGIFDKDVSIACVPHVYPHCEEADANIFIETINPSLFAYARKNIWIPNIEWTRRTWEPYMGMVDEIWVKTREAEDVFTQLTKTTIRNIGWTSIDKGWDTTMKKNYHKAFVPVGKNLYRYPRPILQAYMRIKENNPTLYDKLPTLHVVYSPEHMQVTVPESIQDKVIIKAEVMKDTEYDELLKECGVCICTSLAEGFGHAVNEAMSVGCNLILSPIRPFVDDLVGEVQTGVEYCEKLNSQEQTDCIGTLVDVSIQSICDALERFVNTSFKEKRSSSEVIRQVYETRHKTWVTNMKELLPTVFDTSLPEYRLKDVFPKEDELPDVSIVTLTKDRRNFMPLAKYCYLLQTYPEDKMEWVIVDDGEDSIEDTLIGVPNVTYVRCEPGMTIGQKRNLGVSKALYDTIVICDDDDVYPENTVLHRVAMTMKEPVKECGFCTTIPCYDITKYSSFMNVPPMTLPMSQRVSEATLIFTRKFWEDRKFEDTTNIAEGDAFIRGREQMCRELSPQEVIVSLTHPKNLSSRKIPDFKEPNGCHYGFNEKLFALVSEIGIAMEQPSTSGQTGSGETCETSSSCENGGDGHP